MILQKSLRRRMLEGENLTGILLRAPAEEIVEIIAANGVDFILLDCEHGPSDEVALRQHIAAAALFGVETIVRIGEGDDSLILRALDAGASGIVIPHLESAEQALSGAQKAKYPPQGNRGFALYSRAAAYGNSTVQSYKNDANDSVVVIGMIESPEAALNAGKILDCPLVDGYMIGVSDLGAATTARDLPVTDSIGRVHAAVSQLSGGSKIRVDIVNDVEQAKTARADKAQVVVYNFTALLKGLISNLA